MPTRQKIDIKPTVYKKRGPFTYKIIKRFSRMSGYPISHVKKVFLEEYKKFEQGLEKSNKGDERYLNKARIENDLLSKFYKKVKEKLGIVDFDSFYHGTKASFESVSSLHGFNLKNSEHYLRNVGYSQKFINHLKTSPVVALIHYPKYLNDEYKQDFEVYFEKRMLKTSPLEHPIVFYARTVAGFITMLWKEKKNPFSEIIKEKMVAPISALRPLFRYKFKVLLRYLDSFISYKIKDILKTEIFFEQNGNNIKDLTCYGTVILEPMKEKGSFDLLGEDLKNDLMSNDKLHFHSEKGVDIMVSIKPVTKLKNEDQQDESFRKESLDPLLYVEYRITFDIDFNVVGIKNPKDWINKFVVKPCTTYPIYIKMNIRENYLY